MSKDRDGWQTPKDLFNFLDEKYGPFFWDACCDQDNCLIPKQKAVLKNLPETCGLVVYGRYYDYLESNFIDIAIENSTKATKSIFMNPPYSNPGPFLKKAWEDSKYYKIVCLVPTSILSCKYMDFLDEGLSSHTRTWKKGIKIEILNRRTKFKHKSLKTSSPPGGCMLLIFDRRSQI
jgi:hypothetical protein